MDAECEAWTRILWTLLLSSVHRVRIHTSVKGATPTMGSNNAGKAQAKCYRISISR
jgi:hypothetical protein